MAKKYTCITGTRRWPVHNFQNTLDLAATNAWILYKEVTNKKTSSRTFIRKLAEELAEPQVKKRNGGPGQAVPSQTRRSEHEAQLKKCCQVKIMCKRNRSVGVCIQCKKSICGTCLYNMCTKSALRNQFEFVNFLWPYTVLCQQGFNLCECNYEHSQCLPNITENKAKKCIGSLNNSSLNSKVKKSKVRVTLPHK